MNEQKAKRSVYRRPDLERLLTPSSIAVIGASGTPGALGYRALRNLKAFPGKVLPVNPNYAELLGWACYPSLADLPIVPDCVVIALNRERVESTARECARRGVGGVVIFASGYKEIDTADGRAAEQRLTAIAADYDIRIVGPNTTGFANHLCHAHAGFAEFPAPATLSSATIGLVTQSGAMGLGLSQAVEHGASISHVLTAGNSCDVDVADHVAFLADEPRCHAIALAFEGLADPIRLEQAAAIAGAAGKRLVAYKLGDSAEGAAAAWRHTGSDAGSDVDYDALFRRAGIVRVPRVEMLIEAATFFAKAPPATAGGAAILSGSGGTGIMAADMAARHAVPLPQPSGATLDALAAAIPSFGSPRNPCDATAQSASNPESIIACAEAFLSDPAIGALVVPWGKAAASSHLIRLAEVGQRHRKPVCLIWTSQWLEGPGAREAEALVGLSVFRSMDTCFFALRNYRPAATVCD